MLTSSLNHNTDLPVASITAAREITAPNHLQNICEAGSTMLICSSFVVQSQTNYSNKVVVSIELQILRLVPGDSFMT